LPESHVLPLLLQPGEYLLGVVFGRYKQQKLDGQTVISRGVLVMTNERFLLVNKKPVYLSCEEIGYEVVRAITYTKVGLIGHVTLHTRIGDIVVRTFNLRCAGNFVKAVEAQLFQAERSSGASII
jgi:hypothetical protein